jgi:hypothetical protein
MKRIAPLCKQVLMIGTAACLLASQSIILAQKNSTADIPKNNTAEVQRNVKSAENTLDSMKKLGDQINSRHAAAVSSYNRANRLRTATRVANTAVRTVRNAANQERAAARRAAAQKRRAAAQKKKP